MVNDNLEFVFCVIGWKNKQEIKECIVEVFNFVGMENKGYKLLNEFLGGEQQCIVIVCVMFNFLEIILVDEFIGNFDVEIGKVIVELLYNICQVGLLVVMIIYNFQLVVEYFGQVYWCVEYCIVNVMDEFVKKENN